jgi:hypothetical protein
MSKLRPIEPIKNAQQRLNNFVIFGFENQLRRYTPKIAYKEIANKSKHKKTTPKMRN